MRRIIFALLFCFGCNACAADIVMVDIPDASKILWQMQTDGLLWFRNLNEYNPQFLGCCYNYALDTTTPQGRIFYAMLLTKIAEHKGITLGFPSGAAPGAAQTLMLMGKHEHFGE